MTIKKSKIRSTASYSKNAKDPCKWGLFVSLNDTPVFRQFWWARRDLNPYSRKENQILSLARLPIPPLAQRSDKKSESEPKFIIS